MKRLTLKCPRRLSLSLSIVVMSGLLSCGISLEMIWAQEPSAAESSMLDPALERLWNQSLGDSPPQIRSTPPFVQNSATPQVDSQPKPILPEQQAVTLRQTASRPKPPEKEKATKPTKAFQEKSLNPKKVTPMPRPVPLALPHNQADTDTLPADAQPQAQSDNEPKHPAKAPHLKKQAEIQGEPSKLEEAQQLTDAYVALLTQWQQAKDKENLEPILNKGQEASVAILKVAEDLSEEAFKALGKKIPGYLMIRSDILVVGPDPNFFVTLATQKGKPVDVAFFKLVSETLNGYWPSTMEQLDNLSGCTRFGTGQLTALYGGWTKFKQQYPHAYQKALQDPNLLLIHDIEDQLLNSTSACEGPESVVQELEKFVMVYPRSPLTPALKKRLEALRQNKADMIFNQGVRHLLKQQP